MVAVDGFCRPAATVVLALWAVSWFGWREHRLPKPVPRQPFVARPVQVASPPPAPVPAEPVSVLVKSSVPLQEGVCPPVRKPVPQQCDILTDLYCRLENPHYWADPKDPRDLVTWAHEMSHGASNRLHASSVKHGIYVGNGRGIVLKHPKVTIEQVANAVPKEQRGPIFKLYLVEQRKDWNKSPIYLADEWTAYVNGALAHKQLGMGSKRKETYDHAREMERYVRQMVKVVESRDPQYADMDSLKGFVEWQSDRFNQIAQSEPRP